MSKRMTEAELAETLINFLRVERWEIFQEVETPWGRVDIVAKQGPIVWAIECKTAFGFPVLEQAFKAVGHFHYVSVAVPYGKRAGLGERIARQEGIGVLEIPALYWRFVNEKVRPRLNRRPVGIPHLCAEQKSWAKAGTNGGGYWTKYKGTRERLINLVKAEPGKLFTDAIKALEHHYASTASARSCLYRIIDTGGIPELELRYEDGKLHIYPTE